MLTAAPWLHPQRSWRIVEKKHISSSQTVDCFGEFTLLQKMITGQLLWKLKICSVCSSVAYLCKSEAFHEIIVKFYQGSL